MLGSGAGNPLSSISNGPGDYGYTSGSSLLDNGLAPQTGFLSDVNSGTNPTVGDMSAQHGELESRPPYIHVWIRQVFFAVASGPLLLMIINSSP